MLKGGEKMIKSICPKCKRNELNPVLARNSLSRKDNETYICNDCGVDEAVEEIYKG